MKHILLFFSKFIKNIQFIFSLRKSLSDKEPKVASHSGITCLALIAYHHGIELDEARLAHEYALDEWESSWTMLGHIADDHEMKSKLIQINKDKACSLREVYPILCRKKNGRYVVLAGNASTKEGEDVFAIIDPVPDPEDTSLTSGIYRFWTYDTFESRISNKALLLKRHYNINDEKQPFSLRWFLPEFLKLKGIFAQIAIAVLIMTVISLFMPLFFQIVIDKVLPNKTFTTLNVLGIGIISAILFNACMEFLRNYLLLFATNKIDINTAMKTFEHLMKLPVSFFDAVPSGLLIKHMQQTERIRGFLSGNLFFTILDLASLCVFIPFLMLYSLPLTFIVLLFSLLMTLVVVVLIKPFQRRLNILYQAEGM